jgi:hypothetical protein
MALRFVLTGLGLGLGSGLAGCDGPLRWIELGTAPGGPGRPGGRGITTDAGAGAGDGPGISQGMGTGGQGLVAAGGASGTGPGVSDGRICACSRRPNERNSFQCPRGTGTSASATIDATGGTILLSGTPSTAGVPFRLAIPPGALAGAVTITLTETTTAPPQPFVDFSPVFDIAPHGLVLAVPATLTVPESNLSGQWPKEIAIYASADGGSNYARVTDSYQNAGFAQSSLSTLGPVLVGYPRGPLDDAACASPAGSPGGVGVGLGGSRDESDPCAHLRLLTPPG